MRAAGSRAAEAGRGIKKALGERVVGQTEVVDLMLTALLARGHALLVGVPGLAKTLLVSSLAEALGLTFGRVQFTPDLLPADITGTDVLHEEDDGKGGTRRRLRFLAGPIFHNLVLADEINRTPPKTQSALLEAMEERQVTAEGVARALPDPFVVIATENPVEHEGTYPLPEAQLDRFFMQINVDYPSLEAERRMIIATTTGTEARPERVLDGATLAGMQRLVRRMPIGEQLIELILRLVRSGRPENEALPGLAQQVAWGPGPRASQALTLCARARALYEGRLAPSIDDVKALAEPVLQHRMALTFAARADGMTIDQLIGKARARVG